MFKFIGFWIGFLIALNFDVGTSTEDHCLIKFGSKTDWNVFWPLIFNTNGTLYESTIIKNENSVVVPKGDSVLISCGPNYLKKHSPKLFVNGKCENGGKFQIENDLGLKKGKDLACDLRVIEEVLVPVEGCPTDETSVKFGYVNPSDSFSYITGEACYSQSKGKTFFAHVRIGDSQNSALEVQPKQFLSSNSHPQSSYKIDFMKVSRLDVLRDKLEETLGISTLPELQMSSFIDERLLSNKQLYSTKKLAWNYFMEYDNLLNLQFLKEDIAALNRNADIYIGSYGVTKMQKLNGGKIPIYMEDDDKFPIPEVIWIVIKNANKATAFAVFNDPNISDNDISNVSFCESKCDQIDWLKRLGKENQYLNGQNGFVLCCDYNSFKNIVKEMPKLTGITELYK